MDRIILHWTAGADGVTPHEADSYNYLIGRDGTVTPGAHPPEAQTPVNVAKGRGHYAAHTLNCNTGSIGVSLDAMGGAEERPFDAGRYPITEEQIAALVALVARLCAQYRIPVTRRTVLSHAEVQPTLGIAQRSKWDIAWLPGMDRPGDPVEVGDRLRARILAALGQGASSDSAPEPMPTLRRGDVGSPVHEMQRRLEARGYDLTPDSIFGRVTEAAVKQFQRGHGLQADGIVGGGTWARLLD